MKTITLGSLFDGIAGFPYSGSFYGIKTIWASEILPAAISVTKKHFPDMEHVGDITKLDGKTLTPVDVITFGSPCTDLSIAGRREGLAGAQSGLFIEAIRIINEMRCETNGQYPQFAVWENVPGAMSSNARRDYKFVLEAFTETEIPMPSSGKWAAAGMVRSDRVDLAWRILDAQFWGLSQRRKRIFLVADFVGQRAGKILFKPESLYRYLTPGGAPWEGITAGSQGSIGDAIPVINDQGGESICVEKSNLCPTLRSETHGNLPVVTMRIRQGCEGGGKGPLLQTEKSGTLATGNDQILFDSVGINGNIAGTLDSSYYKGVGARCGIERDVVLCIATGQSNAEILENLSATLNCNCEQPIVCLQNSDKAVGVHQYQNGDITTTDVAFTLTTTPNASARNATLIAHPKICATLCASAAGLSRPGGMGSEPDLCIVQKASGFDLQQITSKTNRSELTEVQPVLCKTGLPCIVIDEKAYNSLVCGTICAKSAAPNGQANEIDMCILQKIMQTYTHQGFGQYADSDTSKTILANDKAATSDIIAYCLQGNMIGREDKNGPQGSGINENVCFTINATDKHCVASIDCRNHKENPNISGTLQSKSNGSYSLNFTNPIRNGYIVRRLVPIECERLMGFSDNWTAEGHDGKPLSDTARYQALGNSIAVPCVAYIMAGIAEQLMKGEEVKK